MPKVIWEDHGLNESEFLDYIEDTLLPDLKSSAPNTAGDVARLLFIARRSVKTSSDVTSRMNTILRHDASIKMNSGKVTARVRNHEKHFTNTAEAQQWMSQFAKQLAEGELNKTEVEAN